MQVPDQALFSIGCKASGFRLEAARVQQNLNASLLAKASAPLNASCAEIKAFHELPVGGRRSCPRTAVGNSLQPSD